MIVAVKLLQSPVEISFSYTWQVWGHSSRGRSVVSLHGGLATKQNMCSVNSRQAGGDCVSCARRFDMKNPYSTSASVIWPGSERICIGLAYSLPLPNTLRQSLDGGSNVQLFWISTGNITDSGNAVNWYTIQKTMFIEIGQGNSRYYHSAIHLLQAIPMNALHLKEWHLGLLSMYNDSCCSVLEILY